MDVEQVRVDELIPYANNANIHTPEQIEQIATSIKEFGFNDPIGVWTNPDGKMEIVEGHGRVLAAQKLGIEEVPVIRLEHLTDAERRAYTHVHNQLTRNSTFDVPLLDREIEQLPFDWKSLGFGEFLLDEEALPFTGNPTLRERFGIPPFSVIDARDSAWLERKRAWIQLGIQSELGRGEGLAYDPKLLQRQKGYKEKTALTLPAHSASDPGFYRKKQQVEKELGHKITTAEFQEKHYQPPEGHTSLANSGTSVFDPVLCEITYAWYTKEGDRILDPFAGGSVRGVVAEHMGRLYTGVELRAEQVEANREQAAEICENPPEWIVGDSAKIDELVAAENFDFLFTCPPYADLEVYSDDPADISNMPFEDFARVYETILTKAVAKLADDRFAVVVIGDVRDKAGFYRNLPGLTVEIMERAGAHHYNEAVLITPAGSLPIRIGRQFSASRKLGKTHQNVLTFCKGNPKAATKRLGKVYIPPME